MARAFVVPPTLAREPRQARKGATVAVTSVWRGLFYWGRRFGAPRLAVPPLTSGLLRSPRRGLWPRRGARLFESAGEAARGAVRAGRMWLRSPCRGRRHRPLPGGGGGVPLRGERWRRRGFGGLAPLASGPSALGAAFGRVAERGCSSLRGRRPAGPCGRGGCGCAPPAVGGHIVRCRVIGGGVPSRGERWRRRGFGGLACQRAFGPRRGLRPRRGARLFESAGEAARGAAAWAVVRALARARGWCCGLGCGSRSGSRSSSRLVLRLGLGLGLGRRLSKLVLWLALGLWFALALAPVLAPGPLVLHALRERSFCSRCARPRTACSRRLLSASRAPRPSRIAASLPSPGEEDGTGLAWGSCP